jgi:hypothetical protein
MKRSKFTVREGLVMLLASERKYPNRTFPPRDNRKILEAIGYEPGDPS